jgi:hypothetical protein
MSSANLSKAEKESAARANSDGTSWSAVKETKPECAPVTQVLVVVLSYSPAGRTPRLWTITGPDVSSLPALLTHDWTYREGGLCARWGRVNPGEIDRHLPRSLGKSRRVIRLRLHLFVIRRSPDYRRLAALLPDLSTSTLAVPRSRINAAYFARFSRAALALAQT